MFGKSAFSGFSVSDLEAAKKFYSDTLGLTIHEQPGMGFDITFASGHSVFVYDKADHQPATFTILNFPVDDIDKTIEDLEHRGVTFIRYDNLPAPQDEKGILRGLASGYGPDIAWFNDPSGNILAILQSK